MSLPASNDRLHLKVSNLSLFCDRIIPGMIKLVIVAGAIFLVAPLVAVIGTAFNRPPSIVFPPAEWTLEAFWQIPSYWYGAAIVSLQVGFFATLIAVIVVLPAAFALARSRFRGAAAVEGFLQSPLQFPQVVFAVGLFQLFHFVRMTMSPDIISSLVGLVIAHVILVAPYILATLYSRIGSMDIGIEEAAAGLGANPLRIFRTISIPILRPTLVAACCLAFVISFDNVTLSLFLSNAASTTTLPVVLFTAMELAASPVVFAAAALAILFSLLFTASIEYFVGLRSVMIKSS